MTGLFTIGIGAGLASALLFAVVITGSPLGIVLSYVAPLPILIAALGWNHKAGLVASAVGAAAIAVALRPTAGIAYALASALPGWWLGYLALLGRPVAAEGGAPAGMDWYPTGRLLQWIAATGAAITLAGALTLGGGDHDAYRQILFNTMNAFFRAQTSSPAGPAQTIMGLSQSDFVNLLTGLVPFLAAAIFCIVLTLNVWLAGKAVKISGRLVRPWPDLSSLSMPRASLAVFAGSALLSLLPGFVGVAAAAMAGATGLAFALQGFAFLHHVTVGRPGRAAMLAFAYVSAVFFGGTFLPLMALIGMTDVAVPLRARLAARRGPRPPGAPLS